MPREYIKDELWKIYEKLPEQLQEAVFAVETADNIGSICENNKIKEADIVARLVGNTLLGILPLEDFQKILEEELKIKKEVAEKVSQEINNLIFTPVKESLTKIYRGEIPVKKEWEIPQKPTYPLGKDTYRESIE